MKLKFSIAGIIGFLAMIFLLQEAHDNAHFLTAKLGCHCWGEKGFDAWTYCPACKPSRMLQVLVFLAGPLVNIICLIIAWRLLKSTNEIGMQSLGFCLLFASLPCMRLIAAAQGGGDETSAFRLIFSKIANTNSHAPALAGLAAVSLFCLPVMIRGFLLLKGWFQRLLVFPLMLALPPLAIKLVVSHAMASLLKTGFLNSEGLPGTPLLVIIWALLWLVILLLSYKSILTLFRPSFR